VRAAARAETETEGADLGADPPKSLKRPERRCDGLWLGEAEALGGGAGRPFRLKLRVVGGTFLRMNGRRTLHDLNTPSKDTDC
jgi:hypothetical protein